MRTKSKNLHVRYFLPSVWLMSGIPLQTQLILTHSLFLKTNYNIKCVNFMSVICQ